MPTCKEVHTKSFKLPFNAEISRAAVDAYRGEHLFSLVVYAELCNPTSGFLSISDINGGKIHILETSEEGGASLEGTVYVQLSHVDVDMLVELEAAALSFLQPMVGENLPDPVACDFKLDRLIVSPSGVH